MDKSVSKIPCNLNNFFKYWLLFTSPLHRLTPGVMEVLSYILKKRFELSKIVIDNSKIDSFLFSSEIKDEIIEEHGITKASFDVTLTKLRKAKVLDSKNNINKRFIPDLSPDSERFDLMIIFDIHAEKKD